MEKSAILITFGLSMIKDREGGYKSVIRDLEKCSNGSEFVWWHRVGNNLPKRWEEIYDVFIVIKGRIRWKAVLVGVHGKGVLNTDDGRSIDGKAWLGLVNFEKISRDKQISWKGFQGFRYFDPEWHYI